MAAGPLRTLVDALDRGKPLFWTGEVLVEVDAEMPTIGQATMVLDADDMARLRAAIAEPACCRKCGCTETNACVIEEGRAAIGCAWAEPDLCTACVPGADPRWIHPGDRRAAAA